MLAAACQTFIAISLSL